MESILDLLNDTLLRTLLAMSVVRAGRAGRAGRASGVGAVARPRRVNLLRRILGDRVVLVVALAAGQSSVVTRSVLVTLERPSLVTVSASSAAKAVSAGKLLVGSGELWSVSIIL